MFAFPALTVAGALLGLDRCLGMRFFINAGGGNMVNYMNLIWRWRHPSVYICAALRRPCAEQCGSPASLQHSRNQLPKPAGVNAAPPFGVRNVK